MPFRCPVEGCSKMGNLSAIQQHFGAKHPELAPHYSSAKIVSLIRTKGTIKMSPYDQEPPQSQWTRNLVYGAIGAVVVILGIVFLSNNGYFGDSSQPAGTNAPQTRPNPR